MQQYMHNELREEIETRDTFATTVDFKGKKVLVMYKSGMPSPRKLRPLPSFFKTRRRKDFAVVPGYIIGEFAEFQNENNFPVTNVEPITDDQERKDLTDLLKKKWDVDASFW
jgi:hypothetical protein